MTNFALVLAALAGWSAAATAQVSQPVPEVAVYELVIRYQPVEDAAHLVIIDELAPSTVLMVHATGFDSDTTGFVNQCVSAAERRCRNQLPVRFDEFGSARFQYLVTELSSAPGDNPGSCRLGAERCTIELAVGGQTTVIDTVFIDRALPPGRLDVTPRQDLLAGDTVTVTASEFERGEKLIVMLCARSSTSSSRCGLPGPMLGLEVSNDGIARADFALDQLTVGSDRVTCGRQVDCNLVLTSEQGDLRARPVKLAFAAGPGAEYDSSRVIIGLTLAVALALGAGWLVRSTDWSPPSESDSTAIDEATYANLDAEADRYDLGARGRDVRVNPNIMIQDKPQR